jgi:AraC-like DNA-binding protein
MHGVAQIDTEVRSPQQWPGGYFPVAGPVHEKVRHSRRADRAFKCRFAASTGLTLFACVQRRRVQDAMRRPDRAEALVDEINRRIGYEDAAFLRRLFGRTTGKAPKARRKRRRGPGSRGVVTAAASRRGPASNAAWDVAAAVQAVRPARFSDAALDRPDRSRDRKVVFLDEGQ